MRRVRRFLPQRVLFAALYEKLHLLGYFGCNWNALFDCLRDLHWVEQRRIVIVHEDLPLLPALEMKVYLEVLRDAALDWKSGDPHHLEVIFTESDRETVKRLISNS